jgi:hypothetical protein
MNLITVSDDLNLELWDNSRTFEPVPYTLIDTFKFERVNPLEQSQIAQWNETQPELHIV